MNSDQFGNPFSWRNPLRAPSSSVQPSLIQVPHCRPFMTGNQSIADATITAVIFTGKTYDFGNFVDLTNAPTRVTIRRQGLYNFHGTFDWPTGGTANSVVIGLRLNNTSPIQSLTLPYTTSTSGLDHQIVAQARLVPGDYVEFMATQNGVGGGGAFNLANAYLEVCFVSSY